MIRAGENAGVTLYARIASVLRNKIATGSWPVGGTIPSIEQLSKEYGAARITVRQAVKILSNEGLLVSFRGRGTFVNAAPRDFPQSKIARIIEARSEHQASQRILSRTHVKVIPPLLAYGANIATGSFKDVKRLHLSRNRILFLMEQYIDKTIAGELKPEQENIVAIVNLFRERKLETEVETTTTVGTADAEISRLLECSFGTSIAQVVRVVIDASGAVILASRATYPAEVFAMQTVQSGRAFMKSRRGSSVRNTI